MIPSDVIDPELEAYVERHLAPLRLTPADALTDAGRTAHPERRYSTTAAADAFYRVRAVVTGRAAQTTRYAPVLPPESPIALVAGDQPHTFHLSAGQQDWEVADDDLLDAFADLGATTTRQTYRTLVVDNGRTLATVAALARQPKTPIPLAATLDWWGQRADHPGSGATRVLARDLTLRWTLGLAPDTRASLRDWHAALPGSAAPDAGSTSGPDLAPGAPLGRVALHLAGELAAGNTLLGLLDCSGEDSRSWTWLRKSAGTRWRPYDTRRDAALGLLTRSHAAEHYASLRLGDPVIADAQTRTGTIVETTVVDLDDTAKTVHLSAARPLTRHRVGTRLQAWLGTGRTAQPQTPDLVGTLIEVTVTPAGTLNLTLGEVVKPSRLSLGADLALRPRQTDPFQQGTFRSMYHQHFGTGRNWLARTAAPSATRRPVPLDVIVAAADD